MVKGSPSEALVVICDGSGCSIGGVGGELQELHTQFLIRRFLEAGPAHLGQHITREAGDVA